MMKMRCAERHVAQENGGGVKLGSGGGGGSSFQCSSHAGRFTSICSTAECKKPQPAQNKSSIQHVEPLPLHTHTLLDTHGPADMKGLNQRHSSPLHLAVMLRLPLLPPPLTSA